MRRVGRYALLNRLSCGDRSDLFLARVDAVVPADEVAVGDICALKLPRPEALEGSEYAALLLAESTAAARLRHTNIARVFEIDRSGSDVFVACELIVGQSLASILQRVSISGDLLAPSTILWIGAEIAAGLGAAHQKSWSPLAGGAMVHGGLSPRSVMLTYEGQVKVLGLGTGRARVHLPVPKSRLHYAAPEVLLRRATERRADLFGLGVLIVEALTQERLFRRATESETRAAILEHEMPQVRRLLEPFGERVSVLIERMIARSAERRPKDAEEVEMVLRNAVGDRPDEARAALVRHLASTFNDDREAQRRVIDAASRSNNVAGRRAASDARAIPEPIAIAEGLEAGHEDPEDQLPGLVSGDMPMVVEEGSDVRFMEAAPDGASSRASASPRPRGSRAPIDPALAPGGIVGPPDREPFGQETTVQVPLDEMAVLASGDNHWLDPTEGSARLMSAEVAAISIEEPLTQPGVGPANGESPPDSPPMSNLAESLRRADAGFGAARYRRDDLLWVSEVASVYAATDAVLGRKVILKVSEVGEEASARIERVVRNKVLRREARIAAALHHPKLALLLDAGRDGDVYFLAYQRIGGESLDRVLAKTGKLPWPAAVRVLLDLGDALAYLHNAGWVHGDLQPSNVLIDPEGRGRLLDLSMAIGRGEPDPPLPLPRPAAATPEVKRGGLYDAIAEQYAFGALAYRLISGAPLIEAEETNLDPAASGAVRPLIDVEPSTDPRLSAIVGKLLQIDPAQRYPDMASAMSELARIQDAPRPSVRPGSAESTETNDFVAERLLAAIEQALVRTDGFQSLEEASTRDSSSTLARSVAQRLNLGRRIEAICGVTAAARGLLVRSSAAWPILAGVVPESIVHRVRDAGRTGLVGGGGQDLVVEIVRAVEAYLLLIRATEDGRRVSPRSAVLALRDRVDEGRLDDRAVEALIDHLREVISALEVPKRTPTVRRVLVAQMHHNHALHELLEQQGFALEVVRDGDDAWSRLIGGRFDGAIVDRALPRREGGALLQKIFEETQTRDLPVVILAAGVDDSLDAMVNARGSADVVARTASPEEIVRALHHRLRP